MGCLPWATQTTICMNKNMHKTGSSVVPRNCIWPTKRYCFQQQVQQHALGIMASRLDPEHKNSKGVLSCFMQIREVHTFPPPPVSSFLPLPVSSFPPLPVSPPAALCKLFWQSDLGAAFGKPQLLFSGAKISSSGGRPCSSSVWSLHKQGPSCIVFWKMRTKTA